MRSKFRVISTQPLNKVDDMNTTALKARYYAEEMQKLDRSGRNKPDVLTSIAGKAGLLPGTLINVMKLRLKGSVDGALNRLRAAYLRELEAEKMRLEHELTIELQIAARPDDDEIFAAMASLQEVRETLDRARG